MEQVLHYCHCTCVRAWFCISLYILCLVFDYCKFGCQYQCGMIPVSSETPLSHVLACTTVLLDDEALKLYAVLQCCDKCN